MATDDFDYRQKETHDSPRSHTALLATLGVGLALALAGDGYLLVQSNRLQSLIGQTEAGTQTQISKLSEATTTLLQQEQQRLESVAQQMQQEMKGVHDTASIAVRRARSEAQKQGDELARKIEEQKQQVTTDLDQLKNATTTASSKITEVTTDVDHVKANVASTQSEVEKTGADLKRVMGDMGVMSGLIATNSKDLEALRALGERNYLEFDLSKAQGTKKVGDITLALKKADPKRNRYTVDVLADDRHVEKKDKTINEPVQLYRSGNTQPYEIVVNEVKKDEVIGYLATPKVKVARR